VKLLEDAGPDGHENVVAALVVATAACSGELTKVVSTDGSLIPKLCYGGGVLERHGDEAACGDDVPVGSRRCPGWDLASPVAPGSA